MRESRLEKLVCNYAKSKGWLTFKFSSPGSWGVPDRIFLRRNTCVFFEFKQLGKLPTALQDYMIRLLRDAGFEVFVVDNIKTGKDFIDGLEG